ncbi:PEPxxWA-CTERM sorting domain-containing protein [Porphyrobacter sp. GA68]|uniref:PEPxxWA-CTERM sorting domain-containing protein n=1 Tax=Porphyrobacter sp. GA68 TaxID=2883480 RepID=UPI001D18A7A0|nr:PEPxxWA-CTERM sorting domain-containing protein [Porphyrobacter sp. GA68]
MRPLDLSAALLPIVLATALSAPAAAQVTESSTIQNSWSFSVGGQSGSGSNAGGVQDIFRSVNSGTGVSEMGLSLTGTLSNGNFFFLHNGTCVGDCTLTLTTNITFTLENLGTSPVNLRFDSQITPGHLANSFLQPLNNARALFNFEVAQDPGLRQGILYTAAGTATTAPPIVATSDGQAFNGFNVQNNAPDWTVADWSATNLSVLLAPLGAGERTNLYYRSTLTITTTQTDCADPTLCQSFQVAFGDPRNQGAILSARSAFAPSSLMAFAVDDLNPAVGAIYDPFRVSYRFVPVGSPPQAPPQTFGPISYDVNYRGQTGAVPEPATWALMLLGFGAVAAFMRRRGSIASVPPAL